MLQAALLLGSAVAVAALVVSREWTLAEFGSRLQARRDRGKIRLSGGDLLALYVLQILELVLLELCLSLWFYSEAPDGSQLAAKSSAFVVFLGSLSFFWTLSATAGHTSFNVILHGLNRFGVLYKAYAVLAAVEYDLAIVLQLYCLLLVMPLSRFFYLLRLFLPSLPDDDESTEALEKTLFDRCSTMALVVANILCYGTAWGLVIWTATYLLASIGLGIKRQMV
jgi:hypothetical protein